MKIWPFILPLILTIIFSASLSHSELAMPGYVHGWSERLYTYHNHEIHNLKMTGIKRYPGFSIFEEILKRNWHQRLNTKTNYLKVQQAEADFKWIFEAKGAILIQPLIGQDDTVYIVANKIDEETAEITESELIALDQTNGRAKWSFKMEGGLLGTPIINIDGSIFFGTSSGDTERGVLFALDSKGKVIWSFKAEGNILGSALIKDERIFVGTEESSKIKGKLYSINLNKIDPNNVLPEWVFETEGIIESTPATSSGLLIVKATNNKSREGTSKLYAFDPDEIITSGKVEPKWVFDIQGAFFAFPTIKDTKTTISDNQIFVSVLGKEPDEGKLMAINTKGEKIWGFDVGGIVFDSPVIGPDGVVYAGVTTISETGSVLSRLFAINNDGTLKWGFDVKNKTLLEAIFSSPVLDTNGNVFIGTAGLNVNGIVGNLYSINADTGEDNWVKNLDGAIMATPLIGSKNIIYAGISSVSSFDLDIENGEVGFEGIFGSIIVVDKDNGETKELFELEGAPIGPLTLTDITLFAGTLNKVDETKAVTGTLYSLFAQGGPPLGGITGVITDGETGEVVFNARISAASPETGSFSVTTSSDGSYLLGNLPVGVYTITADAEGFESRIVDDINVIERKNTVHNIALSPVSDLGLIAGKVLDVTSGDGISDVVVLAMEGAFSTRTSNDGSYRLMNLPEWVYTVEASREGFVSKTSELVAVLKRNVTFLDLELTPLPPIAAFNAEPVSGPLPLTVAFSDESSGRITERLWVFGDGEVSNEQDPIHTYKLPGKFSPILSVIGPGGKDSVIKEDLIEVIGPPTAEFEAAATAGFVPFAVQFTDLSHGEVSKWSWDFGDGNISSEQNPFHTYERDGIFTVTLKVSGTGGEDSVTKLDFIRVVPLALPNAAFSANKTAGFLPFDVHFIDRSGGEVSSWLWEFGDGDTSSAQSPFHEYKTQGDFDVSLTVTGPGGVDKETKTGFIKVLPLNKPRVDFVVDRTASFKPITVQFTDISEGVGLQNWLWDFGDGSISNERSPSHKYTSEGFFSPSLTVSGSVGVGFEKKINLIISLPVGGPVAEFSASPTVFFVPQEVKFSDLSEGEGISSWTWNFGDGGISTEQNPVHNYKTSGSFSVSLTVSSEHGASKRIRSNLINAVPVGSPLADFNANPQSGTALLSVSFKELAEPAGDIDSFFWDFGDGATSNELNPIHVYKRNGIFTVSLTVSNSNGANTEKKVNLINVQPPLPPVADFSSDKTAGIRPLEVQFTDLSSGEIDSWSWLFGDGSASFEQNPVHIYNRSGIFFVSLTVSGPGGTDVETKNNLINVSVLSPVAGFSASPTSGQKPLEVRFTDLSGGNITGWLWDFGDRKTSTEQNPRHTYKRRGRFTVSLTVSGPAGSDTETKTNLIDVEKKKRRKPR